MSRFETLGEFVGEVTSSTQPNPKMTSRILLMLGLVASADAFGKTELGVVGQWVQEWFQECTTPPQSIPVAQDKMFSVPSTTQPHFRLQFTPPKVEMGMFGKWSSQLFAATPLMPMMDASTSDSMFAQEGVVPVPSPRENLRNGDVEIDTDFTVAMSTLGAAALLQDTNLAVVPWVFVLGAGVLVQTSLVRTVLDTERMYLINWRPVWSKWLRMAQSAERLFRETSLVDPTLLQDEADDDDLLSFRTDRIINYEIFPHERLPLVLYLKETETSPDRWYSDPIGKWANSADRIVNHGAVPGKVHLLPLFGNMRQLKYELDRRDCKRVGKKV